MSDVIIVALIGFAGTVLGAFFGVVTSARLTAYRIEQLEVKVDKHNGFASRVPVIEEQIRNIAHRVDVLESSEKVERTDR